MIAPKTPAAQYVRMSTEHQQYSLENQSIAIQKYAESNGFEVVQTYSDAARSGLVLKHRTGLRQLLQDVVSGASTFNAILVYDVSRWGRFQDTDESAHYEFLCKSAGIPVHYCAETFSNDGSLPSLIMKALKRTMAGEYSRELSVKVLAGQKRLASIGFKQGGSAGYGLRRMLVSPDRHQKHQLVRGEQKSIATDRVILVPGPADEVKIVREMFQMLVSQKLHVAEITRELNRRHIPYGDKSEWKHNAVRYLLSNHKYAGYNVFARSSSNLSTPKVRLPISEWVLKPECFEPIIDEVTFAKAQHILEQHGLIHTDEQLLDGLRALLAAKGRLSSRLIRNSRETMSISSYIAHFGTLERAYELIGYKKPNVFLRFHVRRRTLAYRDSVVNQIVATFPNQISIDKRKGTWRSRLRLSSGLIVSVLLARSVHGLKTTVRWDVDPGHYQGDLLTLLIRMDHLRGSILDFHVLPSLKMRRIFRLSLKDPWLAQGRRFTKLSQFLKVVERVQAEKRDLRLTNYTSEHPRQTPKRK